MKTKGEQKGIESTPVSASYIVERKRGRPSTKPKVLKDGDQIKVERSDNMVEMVVDPTFSNGGHISIRGSRHLSIFPKDYENASLYNTDYSLGISTPTTFRINAPVERVNIRIEERLNNYYVTFENVYTLSDFMKSIEGDN